MRVIRIGLVALCVAGLGVSGCHHRRKAKVDTGTATAVVTTTAPANVVTASQLETQAAMAATAASTPVDGSGTVKSVTPTPGK